MKSVGIDLRKTTISICVMGGKRDVLARRRFIYSDPEKIRGFFERDPASGRLLQIQWRRAAKHRKIDALECDAVTTRQLTSPDRLPVIFLSVLPGRVPTRAVRK